MTDEQRRWVVLGLGGLVAVVVLAIVVAMCSGDEAIADEPDFSWDEDVTDETLPPTTTTEPATTTSAAPSTTTTSTTTTSSTTSTTTTTAAPTTTTAAPTTTTSTTTTTTPPTTTTTAPPTTTTLPPTTTTTVPPTTTTVPPTTTTVPPTTSTATTTVPPTTTTTAPGLPVAPPEVQALVAAFVADFNTATANGDVDWLFDHLAPPVVELYGEDACRAHISQVTTGIENLAVNGPVLGPVDRVVEVARPGGGTATFDLRGLYVGEISFRFEGVSRTDTGWAQIVDGAGGPTPAYFARCVSATTLPAG